MWKRLTFFVIEDGCCVAVDDWTEDAQALDYFILFFEIYSEFVSRKECAYSDANTVVGHCDGVVEKSRLGLSGNQTPHPPVNTFTCTLPPHLTSSTLLAHNNGHLYSSL